MLIYFNKTIFTIFYNLIYNQLEMFNHFLFNLYFATVLWLYSDCFHGYPQKVVKSTHDFAFYEKLIPFRTND